MSRMATLIVHPWYLHTVLSLTLHIHFVTHGLTIMSCLVRLSEISLVFSTLIGFAAPGLDI